MWAQTYRIIKLCTFVSGNVKIALWFRCHAFCWTAFSLHIPRYYTRLTKGSHSNITWTKDNMSFVILHERLEQCSYPYIFSFFYAGVIISTIKKYKAWTSRCVWRVGIESTMYRHISGSDQFQRIFISISYIQNTNIVFQRFGLALLSPATKWKVKIGMGVVCPSDRHVSCPEQN